MRSVVAVDLGGTKLATAIVDETGTISHRARINTARDDLRASIDQITRSVTNTVNAAGVANQQISAVGIIIPGIYFAETGKVWAPNIWGHKEVSLREELERVLELPIVIDSDRAGYVLGEQWLGVARDCQDVVFISTGTGIGAGIVADGRLLRGSGDIAGAVGWFALTPEHRDIYKELGCWEAEAAGPALARRVNAASAEEVIAAARSGDKAASAAIKETARYLGMGIANIVSILNPKMIVLGGGVMQAADLFLDTITQEMRGWAQPVASRQVRIELTSLGEDAGLLGAARLALLNSAA